MKPKSTLLPFLALAGSSLLAVSSASAQTTYTWNDSNVDNTTPKTRDWFTGGSNTQGTWSTSPGAQGSSAITNADTVRFFTNSTTSLTNTVASVLDSNVNNGGTAVQLGTLTLTGRASNTGSITTTVNIGGDAFNFSATNGTINLDAMNQTSSRNLVYNVANNIQLGTSSSASALTFAGNGTSTFTFTGNISELQAGGGSSLTKSGASSTLRLSGTNTYTGATVIAGTLQLGLGGTTGSLTGTSGITNNGNITINRSNTFTQAADLNGAVISGTGSFTQAGTGITVLSAINNSYTGPTTISAGTLVVSKMADYGDDSSIGKGTSGTSIAMGSASSLVYAGGGENTDRSITFIAAGAGASNSVNVVNNGTGALNFTAAIFNTGANNANNRYLTFGGTNGGTISGAIRDTGNDSGSNYGYIQLIKNGSGTWTMAGANDIMADTTLNAGTLKLDYTTNDNSKLGDVSTVGFLRLNGGTLELAGGTHQETVLSTTITNGTTFIKRTGVGATSKLLMGVITYTSGALDFSAAGIANVSTSAVTNGILMAAASPGTARVTVGGADWAAKDGSNNVIAYTGYTSFTGGATSANTNYSSVGDVTLGSNRGATSNTFKITTSGSGQSMKLNGDFNLTLGSLLFAGADNYTIAAESGTGRINSAFLLHNYGAGTLTLGATNGGITQFGTGTTILSGNNAADVGINIFGGTVQFSDNLQIGTNAAARVIALNNGTLRANTATSIALNSSGNFSRTVSLGAGGGTLDVIGGGTLTVSGAISSATASELPTLTIGSASSNGTIELTGTNTYTGRTFISGGTLSIGTIGNGGVAGNIGQASNVAYNIVFDGGTLAHTGASEVSDRAFTITAGKTATINTTNNLTLAGARGVATTGALTKTGNGTLTLTDISTYTGTTTISAGTLALGHATNTLANTSAVNVNGGTLSLGANSDTVGAVTLTSGSITGSTGVLTGSSYAVQGGSVSAILGGSGALTKSTSGTVTLTGANTYTGATNVNAGTLVVNGNISTSSLTTVASGATIGGSGTVGDLTVANGGYINPGNSPGILKVDGAYIQDGLYTVDIDGLTPSTGHDQINVTGTVDIAGGTLSTLFTGSYALNDIIFILLNDGSDAITGTYTGFAQGATVASYDGFYWQISYTANNTGIGTGTFTEGNDIALMAIPEPRAALLGGLGMLMLLRRRRH